MFGRYTHKFEGILDKIFLDHIVERRASFKRRGMVDFNHDRLKVVHDHHIKPQNMKTHVAFILFRLAVRVLVPDGCQSADDCLCYTLLYLLLELLYVYTVLGQSLVDPFERAFVANVHLLFALVVNIVRVALVQRVVSQVNKVLVQILGSWRLVWASRQPCKALLVNIQSQRVTPSQEDINAQVEL